ncbi:adenylyltransferase/cytidyltransferase family protein [Candidatus Uhrbacteria bacterium]|nr:adenylyltransferase/cytidyltransferase family protein [Candidatus Uhrbacteria bacterium]
MKRRVLAFGTFDVLHPGHLSYLRQARAHGTHLTVIVARDASVKNIKLHDSHFPERERLALIRSLRLVDSALLGDHVDHLRLIKKIKPDVICLGYDHVIRIADLRSRLADSGIRGMVIRRMRPYRTSQYKSSVIFSPHGKSSISK